MVVFLTQAQHAYTLKAPLSACRHARLMSYERLFRSRRLKPAIYIFTDLDRLSFWELELAGRYYEEMRKAGWRVLNKPASVKQRFSLLRSLYRARINAFNVYRPSLGEWPERYPVFVRRDSFHDGTLTDLIHDRPSLEHAIRELLDQGIPASNTMVVEYAAEPKYEDIFVKYTLYRLGGRYFPDASVTERNWVVKYGERGCYGEADFLEEKKRMKTVPFGPLMRRAFEIAQIEYGRLDYGLLKGEPQIYEINTNPTVRFAENHDSRHKLEAREIMAKNFVDALDSLNQADSSRQSISVSDRILCKQVRKERFFQRSRSTL
jgi:hypothetical protein